MCNEVLGFESGGSHVTMDILPHEVSEPESNLLDIHEKRSEVLGIKSSAGHVVMEILPREILEPESKLPHICEKRSVDELRVVSNGKNDVMDGEKGKHGEKTVEHIENVKSSK
uniref:Uncharacterized protein n=1 Tax=Oryza glumipatula TaxID=40148 RepID=A0A0E0BTI7_9ORYZ